MIAALLESARAQVVGCYVCTATTLQAKSILFNVPTQEEEKKQ
jgi:hypothetical protein